MSEKITLDVDTTEAERKVDALQSKIEGTGQNLDKMAKDTEKQTKESFNEVKGMMRASYMMVSGISQVMGNDMGQFFSAIYGVAISTIGTYQSIAAAMAASGIGTAQAAMMTASLITALIQLGSVMSGQTDLTRRMHGLTMSLNGLAGLFTDYSL